MAKLDLYSRAEHAARTIRARTSEPAHIAIVLGSGLGGFAEEFEDSVRIDYQQIPGFVTSTARGHAGSLVIGKVEGVPVLAMQGRVHYYEGYSLEEVTFPIRTFKLLGIETVVLTNAAGGIDVQLSQGALMVISDHLNLMGVNPLRGPNDARFGPRFPDMTTAYWKPYRKLTLDEGKRLGIEMHEGVYAALAGPMYETPAEIRYLRTIGADMVGMSTVPEAIVAAHMGIRVLAISCVTNMAAGILDQPLNHQEVLETGRRVQGQFLALLEAVIPRIAQDVQQVPPPKS